MEPDSLKKKNNAPRKMKFAPKAPPRQVPKPEVKTEAGENDDAAQAMDLLRRINEGSLKGKPKIEKKVAASQIAFGFGGASASVRSYGIPRGGSSSNGAQSSLNAGQDKEYREPWDYYSEYPVTLPLRRPYSGNPELLDVEEFGDAADNVNYDENSTKAAVELGLMEDTAEPSMFFFQLPPTVPMIKRPVAVSGHEVPDSSKPSGGARSAKKACDLDELPAGYMGEMLVYKSGAVKLKLGDTLYDVNPGLNCVFAQDVVAIDSSEKLCCSVGELNKRAIVTPDIDSALNSFADF